MSNKPTESGYIARRAVIRAGLRYTSLIAAFPLFASAARADLSCVKSESESLRLSMLYQDPAKDPEASCHTCGYFKADEEGGCGNCILMSGPVSKTAHCEGWGSK
jgi:hypothetical protein